MTWHGFLEVVGAISCGGFVLLIGNAAFAAIEHRLWLRKLEKQKKDCPNCGGTGRVQS